MHWTSWRQPAWNWLKLLTNSRAQWLELVDHPVSRDLCLPLMIVWQENGKKKMYLKPRKIKNCNCLIFKNTILEQFFLNFNVCTNLTGLLVQCRSDSEGQDGAWGSAFFHAPKWHQYFWFKYHSWNSWCTGQFPTGLPQSHLTFLGEWDIFIVGCSTNNLYWESIMICSPVKSGLIRRHY
jgi:hypothetical protein